MCQHKCAQGFTDTSMLPLDTACPWTLCCMSVKLLTAVLLYIVMHTGILTIKFTWVLVSAVIVVDSVHVVELLCCVSAVHH